MNHRIKTLWLAETIRLIEQQSGSFADSDANRKAKVAVGNAESRIIVRAHELAKQNGLLQAQSSWLQATKLAFIILFLLAILLGAGVGFAALSQEPVNIFWALISLLGVHSITLLIWLFSFFISNESGSVLIQLWIWLTQKLAKKQTIQQIFPALLSLYGNKIRWGIGFIVNLLWTVILCAALIVLLMLFSTKHYSFVWQTTLLDTDTFIFLTQTLGKLPAIFGFAIPDIDTIRQSGELALSAGEARSAWAVWLIGVFIVYGVCVRLLLMVICGWLWYYGQARVKLNLSLPDYQALSERLQPFSDSIGIVDSDHQVYVQSGTSTTDENSYNTAGVLVAIDIDSHWLPPQEISFMGFLNSRQQRKSILDQLQQYPVHKMLIAIDSDRAPDRGLINLVMELANKSQICRVWFINQGKQYHNWQERLSDLDIQQAKPEWLMEV